MYIIVVVDLEDNNDKIFITNDPINIVDTLIPNIKNGNITKENLNDNIYKVFINSHGIYISLLPNTKLINFLFYVDWKGRNQFDFNIDSIIKDIDFYNTNKNVAKLITNGKLNCYKVDNISQNISVPFEDIINRWARTFFIIDLPNEEDILKLNCD